MHLNCRYSVYLLKQQMIVLKSLYIRHSEWGAKTIILPPITNFVILRRLVFKGALEKARLIDTLKTHTDKTKYENLLKSYNLKIQNFLPTRATTKSKIDHVITRFPKKPELYHWLFQITTRLNLLYHFYHA